MDALRALAVLGMVLSGSIAFGLAADLPAWMYHAQVPPPRHRFDPSIAGISWVDLVFPFFLFCLGAALPLAWRDGASWRSVLAGAARRGGCLFALAVFYEQMKPGAGTASRVCAVLAFVLLSAALLRPAAQAPRWRRALPLGALAAGLVLLWALRGMIDARHSDIILVVLANMAFFGTLLYAATRQRPWWRLAAMVLAIGVPLGAGVAGSAAKLIFDTTPAPWLYRFAYLKYLCIVVPGMFAGEWLLRRGAGDRVTPWVAVLGVALVALNTTLLFAREAALALWLTLGLLGLIALAARHAPVAERALIVIGAASLVPGLLIEPLQGGIHKDPSTVSYAFVSAGLAAFALLALQAFARLPQALLDVGRNPLVAYTAGALLVAPLLHASGLHSAWAQLGGHAAASLAKGLIFTAAVAVVTVLMTRRGWLWKT